MIGLMLAAPASGSGKTVMTCALLGALKKRGYHPTAFKCGPDYIDPMFHRSILGVECGNLDLFLGEETRIRQLFRDGCMEHDCVICESAMGYYDGLGGSTDTASGWQMARTLDLPVILVIRPKGASLTLAAQIKGMMEFRRPSRIAGILLNDCKPMLYQMLAPMLEQETGLPVLGSLPPMQEAEFSSRHLGLCTADEVEGLKQRLDHLAETALHTIQWQRLESLCRREIEPAYPKAAPPPHIKIAAAKDAAFSFCYRETLEVFRAAGAEIVFFSPMADRELPPGISGLYLPGGYPELYAKELWQNQAMRESIAEALSQSLPAIAECGGFLYLGESLEGEDGVSYPMCGVLPGAGFRTGRLVRFGYGYLNAEEDSMLFRKGEKIPYHEFHYWDSTANGDALSAEKPLTGKGWRCCHCSETLYAGFPHLYPYGRPQLAERFVHACMNYQQRRSL